MRAPFVYYGGKRKIAAAIWQRFGQAHNYVEPFFGSGAVLLARPLPFTGSETLNDVDGFVSNFWRSIKLSPDATAEWADWPVVESDTHARHAWLLGQRDSLVARLEGDPEWHDPKIAGYWCWGMNCWIGSGFCSGNGPWHIVDGRLVDTREAGRTWRQRPHLGNEGKGVNRKLPHIGDEGKGVNRKLPHLGDEGKGVNRQLPHLGAEGQGVNRKLPHLGDEGQGEAASVLSGERLRPWFRQLADRLRYVRVCSGDWSRVCGPSVTFKHGTTAVYLDPPYSDAANRDPTIYRHDDLRVAHDVREWAIENGRNPLMRIALSGYDGEHDMPVDWSVLRWNAGEGYGAQAEERTGNGKREVVWFSPSCLGAEQGRLFA